MSSKISYIQSLSSFISELPELIKRVLCNSKSAIGLNITLVFLKISNIDKSIKCCLSKVQEAVDIINCINNLINSKCKSSIISCFQKCLNEIKSKLIDLHNKFLELRDKFGEINYLKKETQNIISCNKDVSSLKDKICALIEAFNCSLNQFKCIECQIKCAKSIIDEINKKKPELCKQIDKFLFYICIDIKITLSFFPISISYLSKNSLNEKLKCLKENIDNICSEFEKIEDNSIKLKHSLLFNVHYFEISSYILDQLQCIETQQKTVSQKLTDLKQVESLISVISDNIKDVKSVIEKVYERRDDLAYFRDTMKYMIPKLCKIKEKAKCIIGVECVFEPLKKIHCSIQKLKNLEHDRVCLEILECYDDISIETVTCITDKLDIKSIISKLDRVKNGISSLESLICNIKNLLGCFETIENILSVIEYLKRNISKFANKLLRCSLESLSNQIIDRKSNKIN